MLRAAEKIALIYSGNILIKGGHRREGCDDLLYTKSKYYWFEQTRIPNPNTHGTGCTLSSAIACRLAEGKEIAESVSLAKYYITGALHSDLRLGKGNGPINHSWWNNIIS